MAKVAHDGFDPKAFLAKVGAGKTILKFEKKHLGEAERWEHLAHAEIASHFKECNTDCSSDAYLQTRMTRDGRRLPPHKYTLVRDAKYLWPILNTKTRAIWSAFDV